MAGAEGVAMREFAGRTKRSILAARMQWELDQAQQRMQQDLWERLWRPSFALPEMLRARWTGPEIRPNYEYRPNWPPAWLDGEGWTR